MKKLTIILLLTLMLSVCMLMGQITITYDDMPPIPFSIIQNSTSVIGGIDISNNGANQTWNLSNLTPNDYLSIDLVDLSTLSFADQYPNGNYAISLENTYYTIISHTTNNLAIVGLTIPIEEFNITAYLKYLYPELVYTFPYTMGTVVESYPKIKTKLRIDTTINNIYIDSVAVELKKYVKREAVGWGTTKLPNGDFQTLKTLVQSKDTTTLLAKLYGLSWMPVYGDTLESNSIEFQMKNLLYPLATITLNNNLQPTQISWVNVDPSLNITQAISSHVKYFPNPVQDFITFEADKPIAIIEIFSLDGKLILKQDAPPSTIFQIDLSELCSGNYVFRLYSNNEIIKTGKLTKE
ncbi:MAG: T9SS type A sorting domain-containing protein [Bacteroidales bacterium]|jgi:hypothetical protein|nr:T9SS type A sorting domain-containing protein [Bacteroidales bacterium]MDI9575357.1 T9SS type A sorting domain-containing protein [Bacteroidota bacterium]MDD2593116.1 T9SS type A sorting domain-containing protein [Bacteroidales bacterium]MDD3754866.1 T9SS type A sorting domain-containing protein [Bacteroidales bacterium]MDY0400094.1 T9SS type A sorting domain-containing protein [Bacteroidales bacterium]